jgi:hypothetical protein
MGATRVQFLRGVVAAGAGAEHQRLAAFPLRSVFKRSRMHLGAGKVPQARQIGRDRNAADAGGENQMVRMHDAFAAVGAAQRDAPLF